VKECSVEGCGRRHVARGYCHKHYTNLRHKGQFQDIRPMNRTSCTVEGCSKKHYALGLCSVHWARQNRTGSIETTLHFNVGKCLIDGCNNEQDTKGYCQKHYQRLRLHGDASYCGKSHSKGKNNVNWKGGVAQYKDHYKMKKLRLEKLQSVDYVCEICGGVAKEVHHLDKNKAHHELSNFVAVCRKCHLSFYHRNEIGRKPKFCQYTCAAIASFTGLSSITVNKYFHNNASQKTITIIESFLNQEHKEAI
jgi:hypothetical protein